MINWMCGLRPPTTDPAVMFARLIEDVCYALGYQANANHALTSLFLAVHPYLRRAANRFAAIVARLRAGTLPAPGTTPGTWQRAEASLPALPLPASPHPAPPPHPPAPSWPRGYAPLCRHFQELGSYGAELQHLLSNPEMRAMIEAAPQLLRILRPLCRMLGVPDRQGLPEQLRSAVPLYVANPSRRRPPHRTPPPPIQPPPTPQPYAVVADFTPTVALTAAQRFLRR